MINKSGIDTACIKGGLSSIDANRVDYYSFESWS